MRGSRDGTAPGVHLVAAYAPHVEAVLRQVRIDAKTRDHKAALELLGVRPVRGEVVVGDAMFCQRGVAAAVDAAGGDYVLFVKDNQRALKADIEAGLTSEDSARRLAAAAPPWTGRPCRPRPRRGRPVRATRGMAGGSAGRSG